MTSELFHTPQPKKYHWLLTLCLFLSFLVLETSFWLPFCIHNSVVVNWASPAASRRSVRRTCVCVLRTDTHGWIAVMIAYNDLYGVQIDRRDTSRTRGRKRTRAPFTFRDDPSILCCLFFLSVTYLSIHFPKYICQSLFINDDCVRVCGFFRKLQYL